MSSRIFACAHGEKLLSLAATFALVLILVALLLLGCVVDTHARVLLGDMAAETLGLGEPTSTVAARNLSRGGLSFCGGSQQARVLEQLLEVKLHLFLFADDLRGLFT